MRLYDFYTKYGDTVYIDAIAKDEICVGINGYDEELYTYIPRTEAISLARAILKHYEVE